MNNENYSIKQQFTKEKLENEIEYRLLVLHDIINVGGICKSTDNYMEIIIDRISKLEEITGKRYTGYRERLYNISWEYDPPCPYDPDIPDIF